MTDSVFDNRTLARQGTARSLTETAKYRLSHLWNSLYIIRQPVVSELLPSHVPWLINFSVQEMGRDALVERLTASPVMFETS